MAALEIIALNTVTPQLRAPGPGDTYSAPRALALTPETLTGSAATSGLSIAQTWNTTGTPTAIDLNVTDTASNVSSLLLNLRVGGTSRLSVRKDGSTTSRNAFSVDSGGNGNNDVTLAVAGGVLGIGLASARGIGWTSGAQAFGTPDLALLRDAANTLALRNGVNAQAFNVYNTYTDASNYERGFVRWAINDLLIGTEAAGTGSNRRVYIQSAAQLTFRTNGTNNRWHIWSDGNLLPESSNTFNIGGASNTVKDIHQAGFLAVTEMTAPSAPAANVVRIYAEDNGAGKTRLMALFATGAAQQIAIEP